jgi:hypothetical protein
MLACRLRPVTSPPVASAAELPPPPPAPRHPPTLRSFNPPDPGWTRVREPYWWRKSPGRGEHQPPRSLPRSGHFYSKTDSKCFICLASDHRAASCRDPVRCSNCLRSGHRERECKAAARRQGGAGPAPAQRCNGCGDNTKLLPPPPCSTSTTMLQLGDPTTRPDDDHCFVPTTYDIEANLHEWEKNAAISWSLTSSPSMGPKEIEVAVRDEFCLCLGKVLVTRHHPEGPPGDARY